MVYFVLKGGEYALRYLRYKNGIVKSSKCRLSIKSLTRQLKLNISDMDLNILKLSRKKFGILGSA